MATTTNDRKRQYDENAGDEHEDSGFDTDANLTGDSSGSYELLNLSSNSTVAGVGDGRTLLTLLCNTSNNNNNGNANGGAEEETKTTTTIAAGGQVAVAPVVVPLHSISIYQTYCTVPGRLTLLSNLKKYRVSIAEIERRLGAPECLNASILGGILRKAKNKDGGRLLRQQLSNFGLDLPSGRRKQSNLTCFSSLVEEEALQMANDFHEINQKQYPVNAAAAFVMTDVQNAYQLSMMRMELHYANKFLGRILDFHAADRSAVAESVSAVKTEPVEQKGAMLSAEQQQALTNYSLLTHGFGTPCIQTVLETMRSVLTECNSVLMMIQRDVQHQQQPGSSGGASGMPMMPMMMPMPVPVPATIQMLPNNLY